MQSKVYRILIKPRRLLGVPPTLAVLMFISLAYIGIETHYFGTCVLLIYPSIHFAIFIILDDNQNVLNNAFAALRCYLFRNRRNRKMGGVYYSPIDFN